MCSGEDKIVMTKIKQFRDAKTSWIDVIHCMYVMGNVSRKALYTSPTHPFMQVQTAFIYIEACTKVHVYIHVHDVQKIGPSATSPLYIKGMHTHIKSTSVTSSLCMHRHIGVLYSREPDVFLARREYVWFKSRD